MADQVKNLMIGLFVTAAAVVVIFILMFLHPRIGDEGRTLHVRFTDVDKITVGTRVTYAGKPVGEVVSIEEVEEGRKGETDQGGKVYIYDLTLRVDSKVKVFNTDEIATRTSGLLGEKNVDITPIAPKKEQVLVEVDGNVIYAQQTGTVEETFKEFKEAANRLEATLDAATTLLNQAINDKLVDKMSLIFENLESITTALNKPEELSGTVTNIHKFSHSLNETWVSVDAFIASARNSWVSVDKFIKDIDDAALSITKFMGQGQGIFTDITGGKGALGKFLGSDDAYLRTSSIMSKMETILDDINHYGLLFQSDKGWQRLRARRMNMLQKLCTPQEFRNYFNDEVNQISTSISRVAMVLNEVENDPCTCDVMQDREFTKVFADLMRRVSMLDEEIRMYNNQVVEAQIHTTELGTVPCFPPKSQKNYNECDYYNVEPCYYESYPSGCPQY